MSTPSAVASTLETLRGSLSRPALGWTVIVCPDDGLHLRTFRRYASVLLPSGAHLTGSTITREDGSRVSVVGSSETNIIPDGVPFAVEFTGWGTDVMSDARNILVWKDRAANASR
jgi:hypothetical protein